MSNNNQQLALFGDDAIEVPEGVRLIQAYRKAGKKFKGTKDKKGYVLNPEGDRIETTCRISMMPMTSKDGPSLASVTGKKGQELKFAAVDMRQEMLSKTFAEFSGLATGGNYTFDRMSVNRANGKVTLSIKPTFVRIIAKQLTEEELVEQAAKFGLKLVAEAPELEAPKKEAKKEAKK